ncbi:hypothetical protein D3C76_1020670 [compost metagenome]
MTIKRHAFATLRFVGRREAKSAVDAAPTHGFHHCRDHDFPVARRMAKQPRVPKRMQVFQTGLFKAANVGRISKLTPEFTLFHFPFLMKRGCAGVRTNNKTGVCHFAFLFNSNN